MGRHEAENEARLARWVYLRRAHKDLFSNRLRTKTKHRLVQEPKGGRRARQRPLQRSMLGLRCSRKVPRAMLLPSCFGGEHENGGTNTTGSDASLVGGWRWEGSPWSPPSPYQTIQRAPRTPGQT